MLRVAMKADCLAASRQKTRPPIRPLFYQNGGKLKQQKPLFKRLLPF